MSEANLFRKYAKEAMRAASKSPNKSEARELIDLAYTWARAAEAGERILGPILSAPPSDVGEAT